MFAVVVATFARRLKCDGRPLIVTESEPRDALFVEAAGDGMVPAE